MARFPPGFGRRFLVTVDAEEEFDWAAPLQREARVAAVPQIARFQQFCEGHGVAPCYLMDYPVATSPAAAAILRPAVAAGRADVGMQLHPWVNPPFDEAVSGPNSFPGNLPPALERAKLHALRAAVTAGFGPAPLIYRAGRYGVGPQTAALLAEAGVRIDSSVRARFDYRGDGGPDFAALPPAPWWVGDVLELPLTTVFAGRWAARGPALYPRLGWSRRLRGGLARAGLVERIPLTPEGVTLAEGLRAIDAAIAAEVPVLVFSFHSPSLSPGCTPYVRDAGDLDALYGWWRAAFAHLARAGVRPTTPREILAAAGG